MDNTRMPGQPAGVDVQAVIHILSSKISALTLENAMLQARVMDLEAQLRAGKEQKAGAGEADAEGDKEK